jgi:hypothetical protein
MIKTLEILLEDKTSSGKIYTPTVDRIIESIQIFKEERETIYKMMYKMYLKHKIHIFLLKLKNSLFIY